MKQNELTYRPPGSSPGGHISSLGSGMPEAESERMDCLARIEKRMGAIDDTLRRIEKHLDMPGAVSAPQKEVSTVQTILASIDGKLDVGRIRASIEKSPSAIYKEVASIIALIGAIYFGLQHLPEKILVPIHSYFFSPPPLTPAQTSPMPMDAQ
ncbi:hypothetical protein [Achromobacter sp. DH1f]|uniref:hypothetical protein n=1 Tax=Achromobacter sp. DH1f TaxID=1397275 RepID=UPI0012FED5BB|nr:hypothetical protein [Achromobacter sp. DH1f]